MRTLAVYFEEPELLPDFRRIVFFDLEWNQGGSADSVVEELKHEIVEIGAAVLPGENGPRTFQCYVKPQVYREMNPHTALLTGIRVRDLRREGLSFPEALQRFLAFAGEDALFASWGPADITVLQKNLRYYEIENPFPRPLFYIDVQKLYDTTQGKKDSCSLQQALREIGIEETNLHRADADAYHTMRVFEWMMRSVKGFGSVFRAKTRIDTFRLPTRKEKEWILHFGDKRKSISAPYASKDAAIQDMHVRERYCPVCRKKLKKDLDWAALGSGKYQGTAICKEHGFILGKMKIRPVEEDLKGRNRVYVWKDFRRISKKERDRIRLQREMHDTGNPKD